MGAAFDLFFPQVFLQLEQLKLWGKQLKGSQQEAKLSLPVDRLQFFLNVLAAMGL